MTETATPSDASRTGRALLLVLTAIASVQFGGALAATLIPKAGVVGSVALRVVLAAILLLAWCRPRLRGRTRSDWITVSLYATALTVMNLSFYASLKHLPIGVAVTIEFIGPLLLALVMSRRRMDLAAVAAAAVGVVLVSGAVEEGASEISLVGIGFALIAGACWAGYIVMSGRTGARFDSLDGLAIALGLSSIVLAPAGLITASGALFDREVLLSGLGIAVLSSLLPYSLELVALRTLSAGVFGILLSLEPAAAALAGLLVLDQSLSPIRLTGMALVVLASATVLSRPQAPPAAEA